MNLIFPNLQYSEGKVISQLFEVSFLSFLRDEKGIAIQRVNLENMTAEVLEEVNIDQMFSEYIDYIIENSLETYHYTKKLLRRGKITREHDYKKKKTDAFIQETFGLEGATVVDQDEMNLMWHISKLNEIRETIKKNRCVQTEGEKGRVCAVCGLVKSRKRDITEAISLSADKMWRPLGSYEQLKACSKCAGTLGLLSNIAFLWRINILGKGMKKRYVLVPAFQMDSNDPGIIDEISMYLNLLGLFRRRTRGITSTDHIFNSLRAQPIIARIVRDRILDLSVYSQSSGPQGTYTTDSIVGPEKVRRIAEFVVFLNKYFPTVRHSASARGRKEEESRILSDTAYLWSRKGEKDALCEFFNRMGSVQRMMTFDLVKEILGGAKKMKTEYFRNPEKIGEMNEYEWDNPLVRISTFFVAERAFKFEREGKTPDQAINAPMAILSSIPEKEKTKSIRKFLEATTSRGRSYILNQIANPEEFLSQYSEALRACSIIQLKEIARYMRMFANTYRYKKGEEKDKIFRETIRELGYELKVIK